MQVKEISKYMAANNISIRVPNVSILGMVDPINPGRLSKAAIKDMSSKLSNELSIYRDSILPLCKKYIVLMKERIESINIANPADSVEVNRWDIPDPIYEANNNNALNNSNTVSNLTGGNCGYKWLSMTEIRTVIADNAVEPVAISIRDWFNVIGWEEVETVYNRTLTNLSGGNIVNIDNYKNGITNNKYREGLYVLYCLLYMFKNKDIEFGTGDNATLRNNVNYLYNKLAYILKSDIEQYSKMVNADILVMDVSKSLVVGAIYDKFLEDNRIEVLLGYLITANGDDRNTSLNAIVTEKELNLKRWDNKVKALEIGKKLEVVSTLKPQYEIAYKEIEKEELTETLKQIAGSNALGMGTTIQEYVNTLTGEEASDYVKVCEHIIYNTLFKSTGVSDFVKDIRTYTTTIENVSDKEAISYAAVNLVTNYLLTQVEYTNRR